jgi:hypothetical protein
MSESPLARLVGRRARMIGAHPWAGHTGTITRLAQTPWGLAPVVALDDVPGQECCVFHDGEMEPIASVGDRGRVRGSLDDLMRRGRKKRRCSSTQRADELLTPPLVYAIILAEVRLWTTKTFPQKMPSRGAPWRAH